MNQADYNELVFLEDCRKLLKEEKTHPLNEDPLPRAQPCHGLVPTHYLKFTRGKGYDAAPLPEYERP